MIGRSAVYVVVASLPLVLGGCADQSKGAAFNECRSGEFLADPSIQGELISDCMKAKSFTVSLPCSPQPAAYEWYWNGWSSGSDPKCYRPGSASTWLATLFSPM